jgi:3D (Asp-Asp-Asp) domain-containing protein
LSPAAALVACGLALVLAAPASADDGAAIRRARAATAARSHAVLLELYALDSSLAAAHARIAELDGRARALARERWSIAIRLRAARSTLRRAQAQLGLELRSLYEQQPADSLAVLLGARSLQDAVDGIDGLAHAAAATRSLIAQARAARDDVVRLARRLHARARDLAAVRLDVRARLGRVQRAAAERRAFLDELGRRDRRLAQELAELERRSRAAQARTQLLAARAEAASSIASVAARAPLAAGGAGEAGSTRTLVVVSTGYSLRGTTATGLPVAPGIAAVDPTVIPLGTRMTIPGYGEAVAADTGASISGVRVDLWFPTRKQALAWGWQTLTVTLH